MSFKKSRSLLHNFLAFGSIIQKSLSTENPFFRLKTFIFHPWTLPPRAPAPLPSTAPFPSYETGCSISQSTTCTASVIMENYLMPQMQDCTDCTMIPHDEGVPLHTDTEFRGYLDPLFPGKRAEHRHLFIPWLPRPQLYLTPSGAWRMFGTFHWYLQKLSTEAANRERRDVMRRIREELDYLSLWHVQGNNGIVSNTAFCVSSVMSLRLAELSQQFVKSVK